MLSLFFGSFRTKPYATPGHLLPFPGAIKAKVQEERPSLKRKLLDNALEGISAPKKLFF